MRATLLCSLIGITWLLSGCDSGPQRPSSQAQEGIAQAEEGMEAMRERSSELQEALERQRRELESLTEKRIVLLRQQIAEYQARIHRLPATEEAAMGANLEELNQQLGLVEEHLQAYRAAAPGKESEEALKTLEQSLENFSTSLDKAVAELRPPAPEST